MRIFVTGATGLIGRRLVLDRLLHGDEVVVLSRNAELAHRMFAAEANPHVSVIQGDPTQAGDWQEAVAGCDGVVHLAGAGVAEKRWTRRYKQQVIDSRVDSTFQVVRAIEHAVHRPRVLLSGSAIGYYGDRGEEPIDETAPAGADFLAQVCVEWEKQARRAESLGTRVVLLRTGMVLDEWGGALKKLAFPFRIFLGGPLATGGQYEAWIHWRDMIGLIGRALRDERIAGPLNAVAPEPVTNREFGRAIGTALRRPSWLPVPRFALRLLVGEVADSILASQRVVPTKALALHYDFVYPRIERAMTALLGQRPNARAVTPAASAEALPVLTATDPASAPEADIRLVAIDVDGTLLDPLGHLTDAVIQACRAAERVGCAVVLATARPPRSMRRILQALEVTGPTINYNGAVIWNPQKERPLYHEALPATLAADVIESARDIAPDLLVGLEVLDRWYTDRFDATFETPGGKLVEPDEVAPLDKFLWQPITRLDLMGDPETIERVLEMLRERYGHRQRVAMFMPYGQVLQVVHPLVDKSIALQRIAAQLDIRREEIMAIGDEMNDLGMMEWAGVSAAVDNACDAARRLADYIVPGSDDNGVARAIQRFVLVRRARSSTADSVAATD